MTAPTSVKPAPSGIRKRGLGRGLEALLGPQAAAAAPRLEATPEDTLRRLPVASIEAGRYQPRQHWDEAALAELADSIRVIQPIVVREQPGGRYEIIAGERRWRASQLAGLNDIPAVVRTVDDRTMIAMALIENIQREDLNPLEEAQALQRLIDEFNLTHAQAAETVGRSRAAVSNLLRLLELPAPIRALVEAKRLEMGHARALLTLAPQLANKLAREAAEHGWSVREVEHRAQQYAQGSVPGSSRKKVGNAKRPGADIGALEDELSATLGTRVSISNGRGNKGRLIIHYAGLDALDGVLERLRQKPATA